MILKYQDYKEGQSFDAEVLVIGTGAGGASVGTELAEAGFDVCFVEEGAYHPTSSFNPYMHESIPRLYRDAGTTFLSGTPMIPFMEGRCVGGSTVINGGMCYRTPSHILEKWEETTKSDCLGPAEMEGFFERVESRVHAKLQAPVSVGGDNRIMAKGAAEKGWKFIKNKRNQDHCVGSNNCVLGCPTGAKQSTLVSYMPKAFEAGANCLTQVRVDNLIIENGRCVGVEGRAVNPRTMKGDVKVSIRARAVIIACGAIQTPLLLQKHRLGRPSGQLGKHFLCHPNVKMVGIFPYEVDAWKGVSQFGQIREFHDEGILLAENFVPPGVIAIPTPLIAEKSWDFMGKYNNMVLGGCLVEDSITGTVKRGPFGRPNVTYNISEYDRVRFIKAAMYMAEMWFALGAEMILSPFKLGAYHWLHSVDELRKIEPDRIKRKHLDMFTVHLMGTARMGSRPEYSVVDLSGELWDLPGCYVSDASIFPTAIAVNPQITIMAMSTRIAGRMIDNRASVMRAA
jgi:choline dehydrogenase-like flavoprotein